MIQYAIILLVAVPLIGFAVSALGGLVETVRDWRAH